MQSREGQFDSSVTRI
nr:unnamed protein product [Callosobruchus chinensis]CAH7737427.1 unnamed protein product [Callosobruchus chinensis]